MAKIIPLSLVTESPPKQLIVKPDKKIKVGSIQLNNSFSGQTYFPLSVGLLQAYAQKFLTFPKSYEFLTPIFSFMPITEAAERLSEADIVAVSTYVWGHENSLAIAKEIRKRNPNTVIIFGGPSVPDGKKQFQRIRKSDPNPKDLKRRRINLTEEFHRKYPFIDMACHGEGEKAFTMVLNQMAIDGCRDKSSLPSISYIDSNDSFHHNQRLERMSDSELAETPSPYLNGMFEKLIHEHPEIMFIAMWETNRGCPYQCTYCDWGGAIEDRISRFDMKRLYHEAMWFGKNKINYIFCPDANYGILERDVKISEYLAEAKRAYGFPNSVSVQNAKNPKEHTLRALEVLERAGLNRATIMSQQSLNPATLKAVRRDNMKLDDYYILQKRAASKGIYTMTDIIFPMPMETYDSIVDGISTLITNGQHNRIQFGIVSILPNAEMADPEYQEMYGMEILRTKIINVHGKKMVSVSGVEEWQDLIIATNTMPRLDWVKTRVITWMTDIIYFNKLMQIPGIILNQYGVSYRQFIEFFTYKFREFGNYPILEEINHFLTQTAKAIQDGQQEEFIHSEEWLDIYWPAGEYIFIKLCKENKLDSFYEEAQRALHAFLINNFKDVPNKLLSDSIALNKALIKVPFQNEDLKLNLSYNVWGVYREVLLGNTIKLEIGHYPFTIDRTTERWATWEEWYQKVVWYGNRRGAYLYGNKSTGIEIAGHH